MASDTSASWASPPSSAATPEREKRSPNTAAARNTRLASFPSASRRACTIPRTESGSDCARPAAFARISSSR